MIPNGPQKNHSLFLNVVGALTQRQCYKTIKNQSKLEFETWRHQELETGGNNFLAEYSGRRIKV